MGYAIVLKNERNPKGIVTYMLKGSAAGIEKRGQEQIICIPDSLVEQSSAFTQPKSDSGEYKKARIEYRISVEELESLGCEPVKDIEAFLLEIHNLGLTSIICAVHTAMLTENFTPLVGACSAYLQDTVSPPTTAAVKGLTDLIEAYGIPVIINGKTATFKPINHKKTATLVADD